jgi:hypothetical protein
MFEQYLVFYPEDPLADSARYFLGNSLRRLRDFQESERQFRQLRDSAKESYWQDLGRQGIEDIRVAEATDRLGVDFSALSER